MASQSNSPRVPDIDLIVNGASASAPMLAYVENVVVADSIDLPGMFTFLFTSSDAQRPQAPWIDDRSLFAVGSGVEVKLGYSHQMETLISGEITALEPEFSSSRLPTLKVRGYDRLHRLQRGRKTRTFLQKKDSDIASQIGSEAGLGVQAKDSGTTHDYILQANQTDWEFLRERARRIHYELAVRDRTLYFRPVGNDQSESLTLNMDNDLLEFRPRLSSAGQATSVKVQSWSVKNKEILTGDSELGDENSTMGGEASGASIAQRAFGAAAEVVSDWPAGTQAEADQESKARFNDLVLNLISGEGVSRGRTDLRAGKVITIDGIGQRFSGSYYVTEAVHRCSPGHGYLTEFAVRRNAS
jgi:phage protein D